MTAADHNAFIVQTIQQSIDLKSQLLQDHALLERINTAGNRCIDTFKAGNRVLLAGNGGSAADAQHIAAEFVCRFNFERPGLPAMALATNYSVITAAGNDYSYENVFAREVEANGNEGDIFIGITTSGNSANILKAIEASQKSGIYTLGLTGAGGAIHETADLCLAVPSRCTPRIQECHILIGHILCEIVENTLFTRR
ncbi:MAG: D-sedoheptulose 7-phosphate isomerase [Gammaproteobacteria bacterium]|nr:D-sedoheptulose 7-phosphate isomerase [Gammaproteobacteria bacterium]